MNNNEVSNEYLLKRLIIAENALFYMFCEISKLHPDHINRNIEELCGKWDQERDRLDSVYSVYPMDSDRDEQ